MCKIIWCAVFHKDNARIEGTSARGRRELPEVRKFRKSQRDILSHMQHTSVLDAWANERKISIPRKYAHTSKKTSLIYVFHLNKDDHRTVVYDIHHKQLYCYLNQHLKFIMVENTLFVFKCTFPRESVAIVHEKCDKLHFESHFCGGQHEERLVCTYIREWRSGILLASNLYTGPRLEECLYKVTKPNCDGCRVVLDFHGIAGQEAMTRSTEIRLDKTITTSFMGERGFEQKVKQVIQSMSGAVVLHFAGKRGEERLVHKLENGTETQFDGTAGNEHVTQKVYTQFSDIGVVDHFRHCPATNASHLHCRIVKMGGAEAHITETDVCVYDVCYSVQVYRRNVYCSAFNQEPHKAVAYIKSIVNQKLAWLK